MKTSLLVVLVGCAAHSAPPPQPVGHVSPFPGFSMAAIDKHASCGDAAAQIQSATRGMRAPERSIVDPVRLLCTGDSWSDDAIVCFSKMTEGDLAQCAEGLAPDARDALLAEVAGAMPARDQVALARAKLSVLHVGVAECDRFIIAVSNALSCEAVPLASRVELGTETASLWELPMASLSRQAKAHIAEVCGTSREALERQVTDAGCMP